MRARLSRGFTLLEAIVTLVIVSLIVTVLMQALAQSLDMRTRLLRHERKARVDVLQEQWFRDTVSGAMPDMGTALGRMQGDAESLEFVSAHPLGGGLDRIRWSFKPAAGGYALHYHDAEWDDLVVMPGPLLDPAFDYLDDKGEWKTEWKPADDLALALPKMVRLRAGTQAGTLLWMVRIETDPHLPSLLRVDPDNGI